MNRTQATNAKATDPVVSFSRTSSSVEDEMPAAVPETKSKRLRNWMLFANVVAWVIIFLAIRWLTT